MPVLAQHQTTPHPATHRAQLAWAAVWYAITLGGWLASWNAERFGPSSAAALTSLAILAELVSVAVRWPQPARAASQPSSQDRTATELVWMCAWGAQANALGLVSMLSPSLASLAPALIVTAVVEAFVLSKAPWSSLARPARGPSDGQDLVREETPTEASPVDELEDEHWTRSTHVGRTEEGGTFLSGWVRFELAADQKVLALTIGFSPAFPTAPEVELDQELDSEEAHCEALLEHATPAGMRVVIKRTGAAVPLSGKLLWHASESDQPSTVLESRLP